MERFAAARQELTPGLQRWLGVPDDTSLTRLEVQAWVGFQSLGVTIEMAESWSKLGYGPSVAAAALVDEVTVAEVDDLAWIFQGPARGMARTVSRSLTSSAGICRSTAMPLTHTGFSGDGWPYPIHSSWTGSAKPPWRRPPRPSGRPPSASSPPTRSSQLPSPWRSWRTMRMRSRSRVNGRDAEARAAR